jgi:hypothetical protein
MSKAGADRSGRRDPDAPDRRGDRDREPRIFDFDWRTAAAFLMLSPAMAPRITPRSAP